MNAAKKTTITKTTKVNDGKLPMRLELGLLRQANEEDAQKEAASKEQAKPASIDDILPIHVPVFIKASETVATNTVKAPKVKAKKVAKEPAGPTKADKAREIFTRMAGQPRQDILKAFQTEAGLTEAGSATYLANCKRNAAKTK
jgi:hypothetical protein